MNAGDAHICRVAEAVTLLAPLDRNHPDNAAEWFARDVARGLLAQLEDHGELTVGAEAAALAPGDLSAVLSAVAALAGWSDGGSAGAEVDRRRPAMVD